MLTGTKTNRVLSITLSLLIFTAVGSLADDYAVKEQELAELKQAQQRAQDLLSELSAAETEVMSELRLLERKLTQAKQDLATVEQGLQRTQSSIGEVSNDVQAATRCYEENKKQLDQVMVGYYQRLRQIYMAGGTDLLDLLFVTEGTAGDWVMRLKLFSSLLAQDVALYDKVSTQKAATDRERERLASRLGQLQKAQATLVTQRNAASARVEQVALAKLERDQKLTQILSQKETQKQAVQEVEENSRKIQAWLEANKTQPLMVDSGGKVWFFKPVAGPVTVRYGWRVDPVDNANRYHVGIDLAAGEGTPIKAAAGGQVVLSGWIGGYGYTVIIQHADGYSTVYAHASRLLAEVGDRVTAGQVIAEVGSTGLSTEPHLHFEVRLSGRTADPLEYLRE